MPRLPFVLQKIVHLADAQEDKWVKTRSDMGRRVQMTRLAASFVNFNRDLQAGYRRVTGSFLANSCTGVIDVCRTLRASFLYSRQRM